MKTKFLVYPFTQQILKKLFYCIFLFCSLSSFGQSLSFQYDNAGNQIKRVFSISGTPSNNLLRVTQDSNEFQKFHPEDDFTYYPNPVQDFLHLKWQPQNRYITSMQIFDINGKQLQNYNYKEQDNETKIPFEGYAKGTYFLHINYNTQEVATVKIVKN